MLEMQSVLRTIRNRDAEIKAWAYLPEGDGRDEGGSPEPPGERHQSLKGLLFGVKDVIDVQGMPTGCGAPLRKTPPSLLDASCVAQLRAAGATPIGKTVTAADALSVPGPTLQHWNTAHTPDGSPHAPPPPVDLD